MLYLPTAAMETYRGLAGSLEGMKPEEAIKRLKGISCGKKGTSCQSVCKGETIKAKKCSSFGFFYINL